ncbi:hypothetical protein ACA910_020156 [Epithemia clementina (nom. ined.)]
MRENGENESDKNNSSNMLLLQQAEAAMAEERYLEAGRLLHQVDDSSVLEERHLECLKIVEEFKESMEDLMQPTPEQDGWTKQTERHNKRFDTAIYYKVDPTNHQLTCLMEAAIPSSLLVPLISIMNECTLYGTWMPSWKHPFRVGYRKTDVLKEMGRGNLINHVVVDLFPPYHPRDIIMLTRAIDEIDAASKIIIRAKSLKSSEDDSCVPEPGRHVVRMDMECCFIFQVCPPDHPLLQHSKIAYPPNERMLLFVGKQRVDAHVSYVPLSVINFFTRQFLNGLLINFLSVGEEVRDGKRPEHQAAIQSKPELYDWVRQRVDVMFEKIEKEQQSKEKEAEEATSQPVPNSSIL